MAIVILLYRYRLLQNVMLMYVSIWVAGLVCAGPVSAGPIMQLDATTYSAGKVYAGQVVNHGFTLSNTGDMPLEIAKVRSS